MDGLGPRRGRRVGGQVEHEADGRRVPKAANVERDDDMSRVTRIISPLGADRDHAPLAAGRYRHFTHASRLRSAPYGKNARVIEPA